jgi:dipeptidyl-peptidase-4
LKRVLIALLLALPAVAQQPPAGKQPLTIEAIFAPGGLTGRGPETLAWSPDGTKLSFVQRDDAGEHGALYYVDVASGRRAVLVSEEKLATLQPPLEKSVKDERTRERLTRYSIAGYQWAPDSKHLLFASAGSLWLYSLETGTAVVVGSGDDPKFSPDGRHLSYLKQHNLFVRDLKSNKEHALTKDSDENLLNGEVDWVYEEELEVRSNYFWSPDSKRIVFLQMNETKIPEYLLVDWIPTHPTIDKLKYPKAGDPNPEVRLGVVGADGGSVKWLTLTDYDYIPRFGWMREGLLYVETLNRAQDRMDLYFTDVGKGESKRVLREEQPDAWVEVTNDFKLLKSGDRFLWSSWRDGHTHLYLYHFDPSRPLGDEAKLERQLTKGDWDTFGIETVDEKSSTVYFTSDQDDDRQRQLWSVKLDGSGLRKISDEKGAHGVDFAPDNRHYVDIFSSLMTPPRLSLCAVGAACSLVWEPRSVAGYGLIAPQFVDFKADDGTVLHGTLLMPPNASGNIPLINNPYGGPGVPSAADAWGGSGLLFAEILARQGMATLWVNNRGMAGRGRKFTAIIKHNFGETELKDQLASLDQVLQKFPQLDAKRLGWWGWSYGGYMTLYAMTHSDRFVAGVAGGPVTDWRDYDSVYTERYMDVPAKNEEGYRKSSPVNFADDLHGAVLLVHGTGDDNVHFQNTIQMANALIYAGKQFQVMMYPRMTHGITGPVPRSHLYHMIQDHFARYLLGLAPVQAPQHDE